MFWLSGFILTLFGNVVALLLADYFDRNFIVTATAESLIPLAFTLTLINIFIRPLIKLVFSPIQFITFGLSTLIINIGIIYLVDIYSQSLTINGPVALVLGTHIVGLTNIAIYYASIFVYGQMNIA